jgi:hypothetical protein
MECVLSSLFREMSEGIKGPALHRLCESASTNSDKDRCVRYPSAATNNVTCVASIFAVEKPALHYKHRSMSADAESVMHHLFSDTAPPDSTTLIKTEKMSAKTIAIIGGLDADLIMIASRIPHCGESLLANHHQETLGGKGANSARPADIIIVIQVQKLHHKQKYLVGGRAITVKGIVRNAVLVDDVKVRVNDEQWREWTTK